MFQYFSSKHQISDNIVNLIGISERTKTLFSKPIISQKSINKNYVSSSITQVLPKVTHKGKNSELADDKIYQAPLKKVQNLEDCEYISSNESYCEENEDESNFVETEFDDETICKLPQKDPSSKQG